MQETQQQELRLLQQQNTELEKLKFNRQAEINRLRNSQALNNNKLSLILR